MNVTTVVAVSLIALVVGLALFFAIAAMVRSGQISEHEREQETTGDGIRGG